jgi:hypothetical protein
MRLLEADVRRADRRGQQEAAATSRSRRNPRRALPPLTAKFDIT